MISTAAESLLQSGVSTFDIVDTYTIGDHTFNSTDHVIRRGVMSGAEGLEPKTLDVTVVLGGIYATHADFKAEALAGTLSGASFQYVRTYVGGGDVVRFTGTVQRVEVSSTEVRIVAMTCTVDLDSIQLPAHVILSDEFPEIPPPENYNVR